MMNDFNIGQMNLIEAQIQAWSDAECSSETKSVMIAFLNKQADVIYKQAKPVEVKKPL